MSEDEACFEIPYARGLQYVHCALLSNGATVRLPLRRKSLAEDIMNGYKGIELLDTKPKSSDD